MTTIPALERGIRILQLLASSSPLTLEEIAAQVSVPKASALRLLQTLCRRELVSRNENKRYSALVRLVPTDDRQERLRRRIDRALNQLAGTTGQTAEWYVPATEGLVLVQRAEPADQQVRVYARVGFVRACHDELEAVVCIAAAADFPQALPLSDYWTYDADGERVTLDAPQIRLRLDTVRADGYALDAHYNTNGIRRVAAGVIHDGSLVGILALAGSYTPGGHDPLAAGVPPLVEAARVLSH